MTDSPRAQPLAATGVTIMKLPVGRPRKATLAMYDWGLALGDLSVGWADIERLKFPKAKTNGGFRLKTTPIHCEVNFVSLGAAATGLVGGMVSGVGVDDLRVAWTREIVARAGLAATEGRLFVEYTRR